MANKTAYYWDSCCFLSLIEGKGIWPTRVPMLELILERCEKSLCEVHTSELTLTEVAFAKFEKDGKVLDPAVQKKIDVLYAHVKMIEVSKFVAIEARNFIRTIISHPTAQISPTGFSLKPMDALHLACAKRRGLTEFHTYDRALYKFNGLLGLKIMRPIVDDLPLALQNLGNTD